MAPKYEVIDPSVVTKHKTFMIYGYTRSGKTEFAATFPDPLFIADKSEHGYETILNMSKTKPGKFYTSGKIPTIWTVASKSEYLEAVSDFEAEQKKSKKWRTCVTDSLTFYADCYFAEMEAAYWGANNRRPEGRLLYGDLGMHVRYMMIREHNFCASNGVNKVWTALAKEREVNDGVVRQAGVLLAGKMSQTSVARCDYWFYAQQVGDGHEIRTKTFGTMPAGGRDAGLMPDPLPTASYKEIEQALYGQVTVKTNP